MDCLDDERNAAARAQGDALIQTAWVDWIGEVRESEYRLNEAKRKAA